MTSEYPNPSELEQNEQITHTADDDYVEEVSLDHRIIHDEVHEYEPRTCDEDVLYTLQNPEDTETEFPIRAAAIYAGEDEYAVFVGEMWDVDAYDVTQMIHTYTTFHAAFIRARTELQK